MSEVKEQSARAVLTKSECTEDARLAAIKVRLPVVPFIWNAVDVALAEPSDASIRRPSFPIVGP
jgi:hypothetical protein